MDLVEAELNKKTTVIYQNIVFFFSFIPFDSIVRLFIMRAIFSSNFFPLRAFNNGDKMIYYYDGTLKQ